MILWLHQLRRDEEGQTLVLGAVFGIVLALCVLGTVNLGRAVYEKMQVQTACDNGAYSQAAVEARVLNLTAYTNRAMVVHYASIMAASAYLTWIHFTYVFVRFFNQILSFIPYIGEVFTIVNEVLQALVDILDYAVFLMTPIVSAANIVLYALQEGAWLALYLNRLSRPVPPEAMSGDSASDPYRAIWPGVVPFANQTVFAQTRGNLTMLPSTLQSFEILTNLVTSAPVQTARLHMLEVANSARQPWTAYGDRYSNQGPSPLARHWAWKSGICNANWGVNARTEMGSWAPLTLEGVIKFGGEIFSGSRMQLSAHCTILGIFTISGVLSMFSFTTLDQALPFITAQSQYQGVQGNNLWTKLLGLLLGGVGLNGLVTYANANAPVQSIADHRVTWISPYVFFSPSTKAGPAGGVTALNSGLGNFGQPDIIFGLARARNDFNKAPAGNPNAFLNQHPVGSIVGGADTGGSVDFSYTGADWPTVPGLPGQLQLNPGFNAVCAAQTYYHRPGDWKEMPNFFNPLWAARLMPVLESNAAASLGINKLPAMQSVLH